MVLVRARAMDAAIAGCSWREHLKEHEALFWFFLSKEIWEPNFRLYWELPPKICQPRDVIAQMWDEEVLAGRNCAKCCVFPLFCGFASSESQLLTTGGCGGWAAEDFAKICTTLWRESDLEVKIVKNSHLRTTLWSSSLSGSEAKILENWQARSIFWNWIPQIGAPLWRQSDLEITIVKTQGSPTTFWGAKCFSHGRRKDFDTASTQKSLKRVVILTSSVWSACDLSGRSRRKASVSQLVSESVG